MITGQLGTVFSKPGQIKLASVPKDTAKIQASKAGISFGIQLIASPIFTLQSSSAWTNQMAGNLSLSSIAGLWLENVYPFIGIPGHEWALLGNIVLGWGPQSFNDVLTYASTTGINEDCQLTAVESQKYSSLTAFTISVNGVKYALITLGSTTGTQFVGLHYLNAFPSNVLSFIENLKGYVVPKPTITMLSFGQTVTVTKAIILSVGNVLTFNQTARTIGNLHINVRNVFMPVNGGLLNIGGGIPIFNQPPVTGTVSTPRYVRISVPNRLILLPAPLLGDGQQSLKSMKIGRSITSNRFTYLKRTNLQHLNYTFRLGRIKSLELEDFILNFAGSMWTMVNWKGETWKVNLVNDPVNLIAKSRYIGEREEINVMLELEGVKIS